MLNEHQELLIQKNAYVPEHICDYVVSISGVEPFYYEPFLCYGKEDHAILVGYPLTGEFNEERFQSLFHELKRKKRWISIISPIKLKDNVPVRSDFYYVLDLRELKITQKTRNILKRARKEVKVERGKKFYPEHLSLIEEFISVKGLEERMAFIFRKLNNYVETASHVIVLSARNLRSGKLVAFNIVDTFSSAYGFYMFNVRTTKDYVPGTSDVLFEEMAELVNNQGKRFINLGLGINEGVRFFKEKWGGRPFLQYYLYEWRPKRSIIDLIFQSLA